jgi:cell division cycle 20-like protein 1 (cofactor of APC complex)
VEWFPSDLKFIALYFVCVVSLWNSQQQLHLVQVTKLCEFPSGADGDSVCSVSWSQRGTYLSVGTNNGEVQIWDIAKVKL